MSDLHEVIEDSISDSELPVETDVVEETTEAVEVAPDTPVEDAPVEDVPAIDKVTSPVTIDAQKDEFEKKFGIPGVSASGRENRIPYSRVKKISEKAASDAIAAKVKEFEPKLQEYETKVKDYEARLQNVSEFEQVMVNDQERFLGMLRQLPTWKPFFDKFDSVAGQTQQTTQASNVPVTDDMPAPDQELSDGTMVYSMDGLKSLNAWNRAQASKETLAEVYKQFGPMAEEWKTHRKAQEQLNAIIPQVQNQIQEARIWPLFNEHETEIIKALQDNQKLSLDGAYRQVVYPKLITDRTKMREEILREVQKAPRATSAPVASSRSTAQATSTEPRNLEDVIAEAVKILK